MDLELKKPESAGDYNTVTLLDGTEVSTFLTGGEYWFDIKNTLGHSEQVIYKKFNSGVKYIKKRFKL